jgi:hypothetical protein
MLIIKFAAPSIAGSTGSFPDFWLKMMFGPRVYGDHASTSLVTTFIRLVEAAFSEYEIAMMYTEKYWTTHSRVELGAMHRSIAHWEACVTSCHRAIRCFRRLRNNQSVPLELRDLLASPKPAFARDDVSDQLRNVRDTIHHLEERLMDGSVPEGTFNSLVADGPEVDVVDEPGQTLKTIDRLVIGDCELLLSDLVMWMNEMSDAAEKLSKFSPGA